MPEGDGTSRGSPEMAPHPDQYHSSASSMVPQRVPPALFCSSQQTPHRVQSSTNLDLVDCVGSDLLLAMNNLDVNSSSSSSSANGHHRHHLLDGGNGGGGGGGSPLPLPGDGFLPLAALAPPPSRQPAWLPSQQQKARVQNEHFTSRSSSGGGNGNNSCSGGGGVFRGRSNNSYDSGEEVACDGHHHHNHHQLRSSSGRDVGAMRMGRLCDDGNSNGVGGPASREQQQAYDSYPQGSSVGSNNNNYSGSSSPGMPPPGFGLESSTSSQASWSGSNNGSTNNTTNNGGGGVRRPSSASGGGSSSSGTTPRTTNGNNNGDNNNNPHLDESWTAVLNAPAGAELMEFLMERPSRAMVLWNVEAIGEGDLRAACEVHGPLYYLRAEHRRKRVIFVAYYDVRDAVNAHRCLGAELSQYLMNEPGSRPRPAVHFSIELHAGFSYKEGSVVVHDLPAQATEAEVGSVFQAYGDLRDITRHSNPHQPHSASFSVEFCSIQDARVAAQELTVRNPWGHGITVEPAVRSETERALGRQLHATLNRWTSESTQATDDRMRSGSSSVVMSARSSGSDSPPLNKSEERAGRDMGYAMDLFTPMTSANTTPATTPGSTPPSGADACQDGGGRSPGVQHYITMPLRQHYSGSAGAPSSSSSRGRSASGSGSLSAPPHPMYGSSSSSNNNNGCSCANGMPQHHFGNGNGNGNGSGSVGSSGSGHHHHHLLHHHPLSNGHHVHGRDNGGGGGGPNGYFLDTSPGYPGDRDDTRTPPAPMWAASPLSLSPPSARGGGGGGAMRGSPPLRGMPGGCAGGPGGLGYGDRSRQFSLDEGRLLGGGGGGCGGARTMRSSSDSASQMMLASTHGGGGGGVPECNGNGGHEFSLDLKKVSKGMDKRTTIMVRNIPNKYTQTMLLQEIDASYRGAYDFFYLPIDFKNKCNVGYAFINFMDYRRIVPFFREFNAQRWKNFNSEKVCAISYARIQGKASMISRFQNSSLMEKDGEYRPLIFHSAGAERGRPEPFPASSKAYRGVMPQSGGGMFGGVRDRERSTSNSSSLSMA